jgi:hypothetical protein
MTAGQLYEIVARFHFAQSELDAMSLSDLHFWYRGCEMLNESEESEIEKAKSRAGV